MCSAIQRHARGDRHLDRGCGQHAPTQIARGCEPSEERKAAEPKRRAQHLGNADHAGNLDEERTRRLEDRERQEHRR
jgi:hypothetical protein